MFRSRSFPLLPVVLSVVLSFTVSSSRAQIAFNVFVPSTGGAPISISYAGDMFVGSNYFSPQLYATDINGGNLHNFGPVFFTGGDPGNGEHFVASSLGLGGFPDRDVYVAVSNDIAHLNHAGTTLDSFTGGFNGVVRGILFDTIGTFGHDMLVTTSSGDVYRVNSAGVFTKIASVGEDTEGLDVAPLGGGFGSFDGQLIVASEGSGNIRAISNTGVVSLIANIPSAEMLSFVPKNLGSSGNPVEGFYGADYNVNVVKAGTDQFTNYIGDAIVTGELTHQVSRIHWNGTAFDVTNVGAFPNQPEDGIFVTAAFVPTPSEVPEPSSLALLLGSLTPASLFAFRRRKR